MILAAASIVRCPFPDSTLKIRLAESSVANVPNGTVLLCDSGHHPFMPKKYREERIGQDAALEGQE
jgi:hypothetical protein